MSQEQGLWSVELADLPAVEVDDKPEVVVLVREGEPIGWAFVFPDGDFWLIRDDARSVTHGSSLAVLTNFWSAVFACDVGRPVVRSPGGAAAGSVGGPVR
ncbi:hypothetical protein E0H26_01375 [Micromonospora zingiberis]|uniref:Uncharacterized protein n=1 Tax=Micromonospora zingiberis TaxID=2053011 RepID=A0A4V2LXG6_9ACTN|nr:hypothetical protein [Micromonospora zingiberis]TCC00376.1 hypothetical protein E0H26_01375 [Micromonospora zingiberis]